MDNKSHLCSHDAAPWCEHTETERAGVETEPEKVKLNGLLIGVILLHSISHSSLSSLALSLHPSLHLLHSLHSLSLHKRGQLSFPIAVNVEALYCKLKTPRSFLHTLSFSLSLSLSVSRSAVRCTKGDWR